MGRESSVSSCLFRCGQIITNFYSEWSFTGAILFKVTRVSLTVRATLNELT